MCDTPEGGSASKFNFNANPQPSQPIGFKNKHNNMSFMDYKTHIFNAALEGNLMGLKVSARCHSQNLAWNPRRVYSTLGTECITKALFVWRAWEPDCTGSPDLRTRFFPVHWLSDYSNLFTPRRMRTKWPTTFVFGWPSAMIRTCFCFASHMTNCNLDSGNRNTWEGAHRGRIAYRG